MKAYTDYPIISLGDVAYQLAPIRECEILAYDRNKYCKILIEGVTEEVKAGYLYIEPGRCGEVKTFTNTVLQTLPDFGEYFLTLI